MITEGGGYFNLYSSEISEPSVVSTFSVNISNSRGIKNMDQQEIKLPRAPKGLSASSRAFWKKVNQEYLLEDHALRILEQACFCMDRIAQDQETVEREGRTYTDRYNQPKLHPCVEDERQQRNLLIRLLRELRLEDFPEEVRQPRLR